MHFIKGKLKVSVNRTVYNSDKKRGENILVASFKLKDLYSKDGILNDIENDLKAHEASDSERKEISDYLDSLIAEKAVTDANEAVESVFRSIGFVRSHYLDDNDENLKNALTGRTDELFEQLNLVADRLRELGFKSPVKRPTKGD